jgi:hypothetical protein
MAGLTQDSWAEGPARLATRSTLLHAHGCNHTIQAGAPDLVVGAIRTVLNQCRETPPEAVADLSPKHHASAAAPPLHRVPIG